MRTPPSFAAIVAPDAPQDSLLPIPGRAGTPGDSSKDFSDFISKFEQRRNSAAPYSPASKPVADSSIDAGEVDGADKKVSAEVAKVALTKSGAANTESKNQLPPTGQGSQALTVDPSLSSNILSMIAHLLVTPIDLSKATATSPSSIRIPAEDGKSSVAPLPDSSTPVSAEKPVPTQSGDPSATVTVKPDDPAPGPISKVLPAAMKPVSEGAKSLPAQTSSPGAEAAANTGEPLALVPQSIATQLTTSTSNGQTPPILPDGMVSALNSQRMKFAAEKNEIAGRTVQKLPSASSSGVSSASDAVKSTVTADTNLSGHKSDSFDASMLMNLSQKAEAIGTGPNAGLPEAAPVDNSATQAERVANLVSQEVVTIRQSGANSLAVSLKLDPKTELFLQLTNHNGQIQASIRCERGSVAGLDSHWGNLQDSLARQNVQLLPLENKQRTPVFTPVSATNNTPGFNQSSQNPRRQMPELLQDLPAAANGKPVSSSKTKTKTNSPRGWESWA